jgi:hypothetical protein
MVQLWGRGLGRGIRIDMLGDLYQVETLETRKAWRVLELACLWEGIETDDYWAQLLEGTETDDHWAHLLEGTETDDHWAQLLEGMETDDHWAHLLGDSSQVERLERRMA